MSFWPERVVHVEGWLKPQASIGARSAPPFSRVLSHMRKAAPLGAGFRRWPDCQMGFRHNCLSRCGGIGRPTRGTYSGFHLTVGPAAAGAGLRAKASSLCPCHGETARR